MHRPVAMLSLFLAVPLAGCSQSMVRVEKPISLTAAWENYEHVEVELVNGSIDVQPQPGQDAVSIEGTLHARGMTLDDARRNLERVDLRIETTDGGRTLRIELPSSDLVGPNRHSADVVIRIPSATSARLVTRNGAVRVADMAEVKIDTGNGMVEARNIAGALDISTSNGRIVIDGASDSVNARSSNGSVRVTDVRGRCVLVTSNGSIDVMGSCSSVSATSSNGNISVRADMPEDGVLQVRSSNGRIDLALPTDLRGMLRLRTSNGRVDIEQMGLALSHAAVTRSGVRAEMNGGGQGLVEAVTSNGSIILRDLSTGG